jgi:hypothetical protein
MYIVQPAPEYFRTATYVYDFQYVRKGTDVRERRDLLKKDGEDILKADTRLETRHFKFREVLFGPTILLGEEAAARHVYRFLKKEKVKGKETAVVVCDAHPADAGKVLTGRAWVRIADGAVLRLEWDAESFGGYSEVLAVAEKIGLPPKIKSYTEFEVEKNGLRFPTLDATEEIYSSGPVSKYTRSITSVKYTNYKFFTVETSSEIRNRI